MIETVTCDEGVGDGVGAGAGAGAGARDGDGDGVAVGDGALGEVEPPHAAAVRAAAAANDVSNEKRIDEYLRGDICKTDHRVHSSLEQSMRHAIGLAIPANCRSARYER
jgi:hypothetical protein